MTRLQRLYDEHGQSPWLDNLARPSLLDGTLARLVAGGIRGVTANPTIFARAIEGSDARLERAGVDKDDVGRTLEAQGVAAFHESFAHVLGALEAKTREEAA